MSCAFIFVCARLLSQNEDMRRGASDAKLPGVVLPSPDNAALTRNISENVDLYTGKLSIDLPIYTFKSRQIEVPISLQTTANSHRVNDPGGFMGMGWTLNAGGGITRVMRNLPDEFYSTFSYYDHSQKGNLDVEEVGYFSISQPGHARLI